MLPVRRYYIFYSQATKQITNYISLDSISTAEANQKTEI